jgi:APA family basic amino acid/polyamine antiporter
LHIFCHLCGKVIKTQSSMNIFSNLFLRKSASDIIASASGEANQLSRRLSTSNLTALGIGAVIGAGIFVVTGTAAAVHAGPSLALSFVISALGCVFAGLCYAEFASTIPVAGSAYTYSYASIGEFLAWIIGWDLILEYLFGASTVAVGWSGYMVNFLSDYGITLPERICNSPFARDASGWHWTGAIVNFPALFISALLTSLLVVGIRQSVRFNNIVVLLKIVVILLFIAFGISYIDTGNWQPFIPENDGTFGHFGWSGILAGAGVAFYAYIGFDAVSTASQEAINPQKSMPRSILYTLLICSALYVAVTLTLTGIVNYKLLNVSAPIALAIDTAGQGLQWLRPVIKVGAIAGLSSVILALLMGQSRIFYSIANDGLLWKSFARIHPKYRTPHIATIVVGSLVALISGLFPIGILVEMVSIGTLLAFIIVCAGIMVLRRREPHLARAFRAPCVPFVPIAGIAICFAQMAALPADAWLRLVAWMLLGLLIYFIYGKKHSKIRQPQPANASSL